MTTDDDRPFCEDCGIRSDLSQKCRSCYAKWSRRLWADIPARLAEMSHIAKELAKLDQTTRKAVASAGLGKEPGMRLEGRGAEVLVQLKRALEGPYGEQLSAKLQAITNASVEKGAKAIGGKEME